VCDIILDPGFGFSKTMAQNYELMRNLQQIQIFQLPLLVGISRKSMIYKLLNTTPEESLNATTALHLYALLKGAGIVRVHDVKPAMEAIALYKQLKTE
jgi:dihydropteroate synthase